MEGVEDIPGTALSEGMKWDWETFPEYLDALERLPRTVDVGTHVPHGAVRAYVLGDREQPGAVPTDADVAEMARIVEEGVRARRTRFLHLAYGVAQVDRRRACAGYDGHCGRAG
jgi:N-acyl-D-amino-acid deacylase